ncbi:MAG: osmoprotectant NAGGN system M42 family peptidase [Pseudomonadota bacterium]|nr:osmoprotectant NAGGN system M42 family peptidase [Pseudomonadota bacterium]
MQKKVAKNVRIDQTYLKKILAELLDMPSPSGMTDGAVGYVCEALESLGIAYELTRRGAIRAHLEGPKDAPNRAVVTHLDTLGAMVKRIRPNGRLDVVPIGTWSSRFAEGARVTVFSDDHRRFRGTILPLKASGHTYNDEIDSQPVSWDNVEVRLDERTTTRVETEMLGVSVGDTIAIDSQPEFIDNGFINARHLDDKAGVAAVLAAVKAVRDAKLSLPLGCHLLFTISEEVGVGASAVLHGEIAELVSVDNGAIAPEQSTSEFGVTIAMQDSSGPFDWHLTRSLLSLCRENRIEHSRDVFRHYRSDGAAAVEAGNDIRTALVCFALDASHGYERTHMDSLDATARLIALYLQSPALFQRDSDAIGPLGDLPTGEEEGTTPGS